MKENRLSNNNYGKIIIVFCIANNYGVFCIAQLEQNNRELDVLFSYITVNKKEKKL
jgi:hypothetical protein